MRSKASEEHSTKSRDSSRDTSSKDDIAATRLGFQMGRQAIVGPGILESMDALKSVLVR